MSHYIRKSDGMKVLVVKLTSENALSIAEWIGRDHIRDFGPEFDGKPAMVEFTSVSGEPKTVEESGYVVRLGDGQFDGHNAKEFLAAYELVCVSHSDASIGTNFRKILDLSVQLGIDVINVATSFLKLHHMMLSDVNRILFGNSLAEVYEAEQSFVPRSFEEARNLWELGKDRWFWVDDFEDASDLCELEHDAWLDDEGPN